MLYLSTRNSKDAYTAHKALTLSECPDGGRFIPFKLSVLSAEELCALKEKPFGQIVADFLNTFFSSRLTGWDVETCVGRAPAKLIAMNHRILIAELWHNLRGRFDDTVHSLYHIVSGCNNGENQPSDWFCIAVRIAVMFGLYGEMLKSNHISEGDPFDVSVSVGDFSVAMAAWYAREMGLPVATIICTDEENSAVWDWIHRGTFNPVGVDKALVSGIERLVCATQGTVDAFLSKMQSGRIYSISPELLPEVSNGFFCSVAGKGRIDSVMNSVYRTNQYLIDPGAALQFGGLQDYRAKTGESRLTLLFSENTPLEHLRQISAATGVPAEKLTLRAERS